MYNKLRIGSHSIQHFAGEGIPVNAEFASWPQFDHEEIDAVCRVLQSGKVNYWTGHECKAFEREFADYIGVSHAICLANGTVAIELALTSLGIGEGDEVIVPSRTFMATGSAVVRCGAIPVFADVDRDSQNLTAETVGRVLSLHTKAIIVVHLAGWPCDMDPIMDLAEQHGLKVIEDCAQAHGAVYKGRKAGSIGHAGAFSFCQDKIMTTAGEGGMLTTNDGDVWRRAWAYKDHGKNYEAVNFKGDSCGFRWLHDTFGTNFRMTEIQAAVGRIATRKLNSWIATRRHYAAILTQQLATLPGLRVTIPPDHINHAYYKYYVFIRPEALKPGCSRDSILAEINAAGVPCFSGSCSEIYLEKAFVKKGFGPMQRLPVARELGETSLMFMVHPTLDTKCIFLTCETVRSVMQQSVNPKAINKVSETVFFE